MKAVLDPANVTLNGIDFVEIASADQKTLRVHFLNTVAVKGTITSVTITGGETIRTVEVVPIDDAVDWDDADTSRPPVLRLMARVSGDFSFYTLAISSPALDAYFNHATFSFKALCPSDLDCAPNPRVCPVDDEPAPPIDYLAKDFLSFRQALSEFSAQRYPDWQERSEADFGVMFMEALSALADDLSYTQDRVGAEAALDTATQRRSLVRHARLVDYEPRPATAARVMLQFDVDAPGPLPSGVLVSAHGSDGQKIFFETGNGLVNHTTGQLSTDTYPVDPKWNRGIIPYYWDDSQQCLEAGAVEMWVVGWGFGFRPGQALLIDTAASTSADPPIREIVHVVAAVEETDPLFPAPPGTRVTHLTWSADEALQHDHDLTIDATGEPPRTVLAGNLVPATQGRRVTGETFAIDLVPAATPGLPLAVVRAGANGVAQYLYTLTQAPLAWLSQDDPTGPPLPEIMLEDETQPPPWTWRRSLLDAEIFETAFTVDPVRLSPIGRNPDGSVIADYDGDDGNTVRFGDGVFGGIPNAGDVFRVLYRVGGGADGNVAIDTITTIDPGMSSWLRTVTNPFPATGGADAERAERVRRLAPQQFRAKQFRAVRQEDYEGAAQSLSWVQRAGTVFRWTGSWLTVFTTPDPKGSEQLTVAEQIELIDLLNRRRMAGYESYVPAPRYVALDLFIVVCARADAFRGDVEAAILRALGTGTFPDRTTGFFNPDRFTFGQPLERSALEAAIQHAAGVDGVVSIQYRERGAVPTAIEMPDQVTVGADQILRVDNDPSLPERGSLHVTIQGGK